MTLHYAPAAWAFLTVAIIIAGCIWSPPRQLSRVIRVFLAWLMCVFAIFIAWWAVYAVYVVLVKEYLS